MLFLIVLTEPQMMTNDTERERFELGSKGKKLNLKVRKTPPPSKYDVFLLHVFDNSVLSVLSVPNNYV